MYRMEKEENKVTKAMRNAVLSIGLSLVMATGAVEAKPVQTPKPQYEIPMQEKLKQNKIQEFKRLILSDKNLKKVFTSQEIDRILAKNISSINIVPRLKENANYNIKTGKIEITQDSYNNSLEDNMFHELTHALFAKVGQRTGFHVVIVNQTTNGEFVKHFGRGLNEGVTEYISQKLMESTNYKCKETYSINKQVIEHLCIVYGEEFVFKMCKDDPASLAERLEKDGVSFVELASLLDQMGMSTNKIEAKKLANRALRITRNLVARKYKSASETEKMEYVNRAREIRAEQGKERNRIKKYYPAGRVRYGIEPIKFMTVDGAIVAEAINQDFYGRYMNSNKFIPQANLDDVLVVQSAVNTAILGTNTIKIEDIKNIELQKLGNENNAVYILRLRDRTLGMAYTGIEKTGRKNARSLPPQNMNITKLNKLPRMGNFKVGDIFKANKREIGYER